MKHPFNPEAIAAAPEAPGIYRLYRGERVVVVGMGAGAATIRRELTRRLAGEGFQQASGITAFDCEPIHEPLAAYRRFLARHAAQTGTAIAWQEPRWPASPIARVRKSRSRPEESSFREP